MFVKWSVVGKVDRHVRMTDGVRHCVLEVYWVLWSVLCVDILMISLTVVLLWLFEEVAGSVGLRVRRKVWGCRERREKDGMGP